MLFGNKLAELGARQCLDAALEQADTHRKNPELHCRAQEKRREKRDAEVSEHRRHEHRARADLARQTPVKDGRRKRDELRDQQCEHELRGIDAELRTVARRHLDDGMHAVDVEEVRQHVHEQALIAKNLPDGRDQTTHRVAEQPVGARLEMCLVNVAHERHGKRNPPQCRDDEGNLHPRAHADAHVLAKEHDCQGGDERNARTDVAPRITVR